MKPLKRALKRIENIDISLPISEESQLPGNKGIGRSNEAIAKIEKKAIINNPFILFPPYRLKAFKKNTK